MARTLKEIAETIARSAEALNRAMGKVNGPELQRVLANQRPQDRWECLHRALPLEDVIEHVLASGYRVDYLDHEPRHDGRRSDWDGAGFYLTEKRTVDLFYRSIECLFARDEDDAWREAFESLRCEGDLNWDTAADMGVAP